MELERCLRSHWLTGSGSSGLCEGVWWCWEMSGLGERSPVWDFPVKMKYWETRSYFIHISIFVFHVINFYLYIPPEHQLKFSFSIH